MTETEATYKTAEPLPECETGSVERMLHAAIAWNRGIASDMVFDMAPHDVRLLRDRQDSQTKLLRNILAKMETERAANICGGWRRHANCPNCGASIAVTLEFNKTTHG